MKQLLVVLICIYTFTLNAEGQDRVVLSLSRAKSMALEKNYTLRKSRADIEISERKVWETISAGLPQISADVNYTHSFQLSDVVELLYPEASRELFTANIRLDQLIFSGAYIVGLKSASTYRDLYKLKDIKSNQDVNELITNSYLAVLITKENIDILRLTKDNIDKIFKETEALYREGFVEDIDVDQLELSLTDIHNSLQVLEQQYILTKRYLKYHIGMDVTVDIELSESLEELAKGAAVEILPFEVDNNINYRMVENQTELAELNVKLKKAEYLPTVSGFYNHNERMLEGSFSLRPPDAIGVKVAVPIFSSGGRKSKVNQAELEYDKAKIYAEEARSGLILQYEQAKTDYKISIDRFRTERKGMQLSEKIYNKTLIKYKEGISSSLDLTQAQNQFLEAQSDYFTTAMELITARNSLDKLLH